MVQRSKVTSSPKRMESGNCAVTNSGVFTHVGSVTSRPDVSPYDPYQSDPYPSGFRYDPSLLPPLQSLPTTLSTFDLSATDPAWVNLKFNSDIVYPWGLYNSNYTSPRLFYVPSSSSALGGGNHSTNPTLVLSFLSTVNRTDIIFAQEDGNRMFHNAGTMTIDTTYFERIITTTSTLGRLYAIGYPYANPNAIQVVSIPMTIDSMKTFPTAGVKVYSASSTASACTGNQYIASMVGNDTFYMLCGGTKEPTTRC
ncbi:hypothetical protein BGZ83_007595 [Gryganskiella cystojenkinii]|nr:hypothetical protein BGZ83_007595 [Gryganskiella cystojenkinii]